MLGLMSEVMRILSAVEQGDPRAAAQLLPLVYDELRLLAAHKLAQVKPGQTLTATALVHEAYLRLVDVEQAQQWNSRGHFFAAAAEAMRRILVERARHQRSQKAGGDRRRVDLADVEAPNQSADEMLALHEALEALEQRDSRKATLVKLRFFAGLTNEQAAAALGISPSTADNDWAYARSWLKLKITGGGDAGNGLGGGLYIGGGTVSINNSTLAGNQATDLGSGIGLHYGGGIYNAAGPSALQMYDTILADNSADRRLRGAER
jgi:RNA polymerase sigma factor (TIGR02999 family)